MVYINHLKIHSDNKDNINSKFYTNTNINVNNIKNLKLAWKYKDLPENKLEKYWIESVQISPVFADGKIFYMRAGYKLNAINQKMEMLFGQNNYFINQQEEDFYGF